MTATYVGRAGWSYDRAEDGTRTYKLVSKVLTDNVNDGPQVVQSCPGLPAIGSTWNQGNDADPWAFCIPEMGARMYPDYHEEPGQLWLVTQTFTTRPVERCWDTSIENPLLEPQKVSGSFVRFSKLAEKDRDGNLMTNSSHEMLPATFREFDDNRASVRVEQNVIDLQLPTVTELLTPPHLNDSSLWGLAKRKVKFSGFSWTRKYYGICTAYYTRVLEFEIDFETWDKTAVDYGTKVLKGDYQDGSCAEDETPVWVPESGLDADKKINFIQFYDCDGNRISTYLDGAGNPLDETGTAGPVDIDVGYYPEGNLLTLGIPLLL